MDIRSFFGGGGGSTKADSGKGSKATTNEISASDFFGGNANKRKSSQVSAEQQASSVATTPGNQAKGSEVAETAPVQKKQRMEPPSNLPDDSGSNGLASNGADASKKRKLEDPPSKIQETTAAPRKLPEGPEDCLSKFTVVITGVLPTMERDDMVDFIRQHGGRVTGSISSRTTHLIAGMRLEDGRPVEASRKYKMASSQSGCRILGENDMIQLVQDVIDRKGQATVKSPPKKKKKAVPPVSRKMSSFGMQSGGSSSKSKKKKKEEVNVLWVNKYKPQSIDDLVGNAANAKRLLSWLQQWYVTANFYFYFFIIAN